MQTCPRCGSILTGNSGRCPSCTPVSLGAVGGAPAAPGAEQSPATAPVLGQPTPAQEMMAQLADYAEHDREDRRTAIVALTMMLVMAVIGVLTVGGYIYSHAQMHRSHTTTAVPIGAAEPAASP